MISQVNDDFRACFARLPAEIQKLATKNHKLWRADPQHPSLRFKRAKTVDPIYSIRIGIGWRALGLLEDNTITWFWIGSHAEYERILRSVP